MMGKSPSADPRQIRRSQAYGSSPVPGVPAVEPPAKPEVGSVRPPVDVMKTRLVPERKAAGIRKGHQGSLQGTVFQEESG